MIRQALSAAFALSIAYPATAQTLNMMKGIDAPHILAPPRMTPLIPFTR